MESLELALALATAIGVLLTGWAIYVVSLPWPEPPRKANLPERPKSQMTEAEKDALFTKLLKENRK